MEKHNRKKILFFISHQPNPRFIKQLNYLSNNNDVILYHYKRSTLASLSTSISEDIIVNDLGDLPNMSNPLKRVMVYLSTMKRIKKELSKLSYDIILVNNIDLLILLLFTRSIRNKKIKITIEISDLRDFVFSKKMSSSILRKIERFLYVKYVDKLIVTSEKYYTNHYSNFFKKEYFLLENKLLESNLKDSAQSDKEYDNNSKFRIGIVGLLLRGDEYIQLFEHFKNSSSVEIAIHGLGRYEDLVTEYSEKYDNITYYGLYNMFNDAKRIYDSLDALYVVYDAEKISENNKLALPNKLYESMYYKVPIICSKNTYLAEIVDEYGIGVAINYKDKNDMKNSVNYIKENHKNIYSNFSKVPENRYLGDNDYAKLEEYLIFD